jgi:hypothetical protein
MPVTTPAVFTVATLVTLLVQLPPGVLFVRLMVWATHTLVGPDVVVNGFTTTGSIAVQPDPKV